MTLTDEKTFTVKIGHLDRVGWLWSVTIGEAACYGHSIDDLEVYMHELLTDIGEIREIPLAQINI